MSAHSLPLLTNFWDHYVPPPGYESNVLALRSLILKSQQPQTCNNLCGIRKSLWVGGSTQNLRKLAHALLQAALGRLMVAGRLAVAVGRRVVVRRGALMAPLRVGAFLTLSPTT